MRVLPALLVMVVWSCVIYYIVSLIGPAKPTMGFGTVLWGLLAAVLLLIGIIGNVWIFFAIVKERFWSWWEGKDS